MATAEGRHDVVCFFAGQEEEPRERRKKRANVAPAEGRHDVVCFFAGREEELRERRKRACEYGPAEGKVFFETRRFCCCGFLFCVLK